MESTNPFNVHIGQEIKAEMTRQGRRVTWLAEQLHCDRTNIYKIYNKPSIDCLLLFRISKLLNVDFVKVYCLASEGV